MSIQQVNGDPVSTASTDNNGGSVINGGSTTTLNNVSLGYSDVEVFGSTVLDNDHADKSIDAGIFAFDNNRPVAKRVTTTLAGEVSNTTLRSGASQPGLIRSVHKLEVLRTRRLTAAIRSGKWNIFKGKFLNNQNQTADKPVVAVDSLATDNAANPSRSAPGQLIYKTGAPVPVQDDYKEKTG